MSYPRKKQWGSKPTKQSFPETLPVFVEKPFSPSPMQQGFFEWVKNGSGSCILEAVAGSGKTTTLVHALPLMRGSIFFGAFNKKISEELALRSAHLPNVTTSTLHSLGYGIWKSHVRKCKVDSWKCHNLFKELFLSEEEQKYLYGVKELVSFAKQRAFTREDIADIPLWESIIDHFSVDLPDDSTGITMAQSLLRASNEIHDVVDFDDMIYLPVLHSLKPSSLFDWVLIDEAQDTNPARRKLFLSLLSPTSRLVAVGDRHQAIYGFTGACSSALSIIQHEVKATTLPLTVSYRCPKRVVAEAQKYVSHIQAHEDAPEGEVIEGDRELLLSATTGDVILARVNAPLVKLAYEYISKGIPAKVEGREIGSGIKALLGKVGDYFSSFEELRHLLEVYEDAEISRLISKGHTNKAAILSDKMYCLRVIVDRAEEVNNFSNSNILSAIHSEIDSLFGDNLTGVITLSSIHKSKGKEWDNVYYLQLEQNSHSRKLKEWEKEQENNLRYVAITRAKKKLVLVEY